MKLKVNPPPQIYSELVQVEGHQISSAPKGFLPGGHVVDGCTKPGPLHPHVWELNTYLPSCSWHQSFFWCVQLLKQALIVCVCVWCVCVRVRRDPLHWNVPPVSPRPARRSLGIGTASFRSISRLSTGKRAQHSRFPVEIRMSLPLHPPGAVSIIRLVPIWVQAAEIGNQWGKLRPGWRVPVVCCPPGVRFIIARFN